MTDREALTDVVAALAAAISLLGRTPNAKKAAPSDNMFNQMMADYEKALDAGRAALAALAPSEAGAVAWASRAELDEAHLTIQKSARVYVKKRSDDHHLDTPLYAHPSPVPAETEPFCVSLYREAALREPAPVPAEYVRVARSTLEYWRELATDNPNDLVPRINHMLTRRDEGEKP